MPDATPIHREPTSNAGKDSLGGIKAASAPLVGQELPTNQARPTDVPTTRLPTTAEQSNRLDWRCEMIVKMRVTHDRLIRTEESLARLISAYERDARHTPAGPARDTALGALEALHETFNTEALTEGEDIIGRATRVAVRALDAEARRTLGEESESAHFAAGVRDGSLAAACVLIKGFFDPVAHAHLCRSFDDGHNSHRSWDVPTTPGAILGFFLHNTYVR